MKALEPHDWIILQGTHPSGTGTYPVASTTWAAPVWTGAALTTPEVLVNPGAISMDGYKDASFDVFITGGAAASLTFTVEGSNDPSFASATTLTFGNLHDITAGAYNPATGAMATPPFTTGLGTSLTFSLSFPGVGTDYKYIRAKLVTGGAAVVSGNCVIHCIRSGARYN